LSGRVTGAQAGQRVRLDATATDRQGRVFSSNATFVAGTDGTVDVASAAPVGGSYTGAHATGLLWSMVPTGRSDFYFTPAPSRPTRSAGSTPGPACCSSWPTCGPAPEPNTGS
jgi:hypothetical protein